MLVVLKSYSVQTFLAQRFTVYLSNELETEVSLKTLQIDFPKTLVLNDLYIQDLHQDTLVYTEKLAVDFRSIDWSFQAIELQSIHLIKPYLNIYSLEKDSNNLQFILNHFESNGAKKGSFKLSSNEVFIEQGKFRYHLNEVTDSISFGIDYNHLEVDHINLAAYNFEQDVDLKVQIDSLALYEKSGFQLNQLASAFVMSDTAMDFQDLQLSTPFTQIQANYKMEYDSISDFSDFIHRVKLSAQFASSKIAISDLSYFSPDLKNLIAEINLEGLVSGTVDNLKGRAINLTINNAVELEGRFDLRGLPRIDETYIYMKLNKLTASIEDLSQLPFPPFEDNRKLQIPENMHSLGKLLFKGEYTGFYNDFVAYGILDTDLGRVKTDILFSEEENGFFNYSGDVFSEAFSVGSMIDFPQLSNVGLDMSIEGKGTSIENANATVSGKLQSLTLNDYEYNDITIEGELSKQKFKGDLTLRDENLKFDFKGLFDMSQNEAVYNFDLDLIDSKLANLNLFRKDDPLTKLRFNANLNLIGNNLDNLKGRALFDSLEYSDARFDQFVKSIDLKAEGGTEDRRISLKSNLVDAEINGQIFFDELVNSMIKYLDYYLPDQQQSRQFNKEQAFNFDILLKDISPINKIFYPELIIDTNTRISGNFNTTSHSSLIHLSSNLLSFNEKAFENLDATLRSDFDIINLELSSNNFQLNRLNFVSPYLTASLDSGELNSQLKWFTDSSNSSNGSLSIAGHVFDLDSLNFSLNDSYFYLGDSLWEFLSPNLISINSHGLRINNLQLENENQAILMDGKIGSSNEDSLDLEFRNMQLEYFSNLLPKEVVDLGGVVNGKSMVKKYNSEYAISSDLMFKDLSVNQTYIGKSYIKSEWIPELEAFKVIASLGENESEAFSISGSIYPFKEQNALDLILNFNQTPIAVLKPYLTDYVTEVDGTLDGQIQILGETSKPIIEGELKLEETEFRVVYLNTKYYIDDKIVIRPDFIGFDLIEIKDENGQTAIGTGTIFHNNYSDFNLDIGLEFENFLALNTNSTQNDLYYGTAIASGTGNISGYSDQLIIEFDASTEKGSVFNVPISTDVETSNLDFIQFTNSPIEVAEKTEIDLKGIQMNFDLDVKPETRIRIIFDEQVGDIMSGTGEGNLKLEINTLGDFNMYGQYTVNKGDYLFTLQNIINKKFDIASGSSVSWDGDPYAAKIDIKAIYNLRASLYDLIPDDSTINTKRRVPVELELQLTEELLNPNIDFDIRLPNSNENIKRRLESILYLNSTDMNKQEVNQQVFGLLVLNRFLPPSSGITNQNQVDRGTPGVNNGFELISNQLSNWLSKVSNQFDIGINYRPGDEIANEELDLSVSTEVLNERLILDGNFGYTNSNNTIEDNQDNNNFIGEFSAEYKISKDGRFRLRGFNRSANNNLLQNFSPYTQGIGVFYRKEFDTFQELWRSYFSKVEDD